MVLLATPLLARLYPPADFGTLALLFTVGNLGMTAGCLRYDVAIPSAAAEDVRGLVVACLLSAMALGLAATAGAAWAAGMPWAVGHAADLLAHPVLLGACIALVGAYQAAGASLLRQGRFGGVAALRLSQGGSFGVMASFPPLGLLWAHALSFAGGLPGLWRILREPGRRPWREVASRYRQFPLLGLPGSLLDVVGSSLSIWVVASAFGRQAAGEYSQVQRLIGAPLLLLSLSLGQVLLKQTADLSSDRTRLRALLARLLIALVASSAVGLIVLAAVGAPLLRWILGPAWHVDRELVVLVAAAVFVRTCASPLSVVLLTLRRFRLALAWQAAYFLSASLLLPWVAAHVGFEAYVRFFAAHEATFYGAYLYLVFFALRER